MNIPAARNFPPGDLRVSDADRDRAISELGEHFQAGRITAEELEERSGLALRARTGNDLASLLADLPPLPGPASLPPLPAPGGAGLPRHAAGATVAVIACALLCAGAALVLVGSGNSGHHEWGGVVGPLLILAIILRLRLARGGSGPGRGNDR